MVNLTEILNGISEINGLELHENILKGVRVSYKPDGTVKSDIRRNDTLERVLRIHATRTARGHEVHGTSKTTITSLEPSYLQKVARQLLDYVLLQENPPYQLFCADGISYHSPLTADPIITTATNKELVLLAHEFHEKIRHACEAEQEVKLANLEVHITDNDTNYSNSRQTELSQRTTSVLIELTLAGFRNGRRSEYTINIRARSLAQINPEEIVRRYAEYARILLEAEQPPAYTGAVIVTGDAIKDVLGNPEDGVSSNPLQYHLSAETVYRNGYRLKLEKQVSQQSIGDSLTLISDPLLPLGTGSIVYGHDGLPAKKIILVENGVVKNFVTDNKHSQLTGLPVTGPLGNMVILPGTKTMDELIHEAEVMNHGSVVIVDAFSWFNPDSMSGDFSAEIRAGRLYKDGKFYPIKGGTVSGNMFDAYGNMHLSREIVFTGNYQGPEAVRFNNLNISGQ